jgi:hypothetical protein
MSCAARYGAMIRIGGLTEGEPGLDLPLSSCNGPCEGEVRSGFAALTFWLLFNGRFTTWFDTTLC